MVIWLVGMSGAGKSTVAEMLFKKLIHHAGIGAVPLDGDLVRLIDGNDKKNTSYSIEARYLNAKRIQEISLALDKSGENVICSILCIFPEILEENKKIFTDYFEVYLDCSIEELERRDTKGLYNLAKKGELNDFVGHDIDFPIPKNPNLKLRTDKDYSANDISDFIYEKVKHGLSKSEDGLALSQKLIETRDISDYAKIISEKIREHNI
tara:strand:- start:34769 stop:35395 length:627 start_codon:yes stop_codon:yes gene_type:complete